MTLPFETRGSGPRLVLVHGFTQNRGCWGRFADRLAERFELVLIDAPGHGAADPTDDAADLWEAGRLIVETGGDAHYLGYSMGGRMAMHGALQSPDLVRSLTLIGATAGIDDPDDRAQRRVDDEALADRLLADGLPAFLERWLALPLFATLPAEAAALEARLTNRPAGLAASLRRCGTGTQEALWDRLVEIDTPTLVVAGSDDTKFTALGRRLVDHSLDARFASADGGHAIHSEQPEAVAALVSDFVRSVEG